MTPAEYKEKLKLAADNLSTYVDNAFDAALDELDAQISQRVFKELRDIYGNGFGVYKSEAYKKYRKSLGRDISKKDLQLFGNLRLSFFKNYPKRQLEFNTQLQANKGRGQEKQLVTRIFEASEEETKQALQVVEEVFLEQLQNAFAA